MNRSSTTPPRIGDLPDFRDTAESRDLPEAGHVDQAPIALANSAASVREALPSGADPFYLSKASLTKYGIDENYTYTWALDTTGTPWQHHTVNDRVTEVLESSPGSQLVEFNGRPVRKRDLVLIKVPKITREAQHKHWAAVEATIRGEVENETLPGSYQAKTLDDRKAIRDYNSSNVLPGLGVGAAGNSPTSGMTLAEAMRIRRPEDVATEIAQCRSGGRTDSASQETRFDDAARSRRERSGTPSNWSGFGPGQRARTTSGGK